MKQILDTFISLLRERFGTQIETTEDCIRYTFFAALLHTGLKPHQIVQEHRHPALGRKEVDTWIPNYKGSEYFIEFKFDRVSSGEGSTQNKTDRSGKLLNDMLRLAMIPSKDGKKCHRMFFYLTDTSMHTYFTNPNNGYIGIYDGNCNQTQEITEQFMTTRPHSARKEIKCQMFPILVTLVNKVAVNQFNLRIFLIERKAEPLGGVYTTPYAAHP